MQALKNIKIRHKLTAIIMLTCVVSLVAVGVVFVVLGYSSSRESMVQSLSTHAEMIANNCKAAVTFGDSKDAEETLSSLHIEPSIVYSCIYTNDDKNFASYSREGYNRISHTTHHAEDGHNFNDGLLSVFRRIVVDNETIGSVCLRSDLQPLQTALMHNIYMVISVLLCVSLAAYLLSSKLQSIISAPILGLTKVARNVTENKDYSTQAVKQSNDEIGVLIDSFNEMLTQINKHKIQLVEMNENLEEKVSERTSDLTKEIADRKQTQKTLRKERNFSQSIVETAQVIMLHLDTEGRIVSFNPYMEDICGYRLEEVRGKDWFETFLSRRDRRRIRELFKKAASDIQTRGNVSPIVTKDGLEVEIEWYDKTLKDINGDIAGVLSIGQDVTEKKQYEEKLKQSIMEAQAANKAKSQFLANMSHEIRTPMNAIIGFSNILADENLTDEQVGYVNIVRDSGNNLLDLINDILDFSKIEAKQLETEMIECSLGRLLNFIDSIMEPVAKKKSLDFNVIEGEGLPEKVCTDPARLKQCLINLTNNAIKFTETGHVYINVSLEDRDDQPYIRFDIEDTGIGIAEDKQVKVFESFTQADGDTTRKYGGTGLGLTITKQLAELLGGEITLTSEVGKGSVFSLVVPAGLDVTKQSRLDTHAVHTKPDYAETEQPEFSGNVLVAEDVKTNQMLIKTLLERLGLQVTIVEDGNQALQEALAHQFDLILMDIQMPNMNGYEATEAIKKEGITTPVIALTANAMKGDDKKCVEAGCDDYLAKPIDRTKLVEVLDKYLPVKAV